MMKHLALLLALLLSMAGYAPEISAKDTQAAKAPLHVAATLKHTVQTLVLNDITVMSLVDSPHTFTTADFPNIDQFPEHKAHMPSGTFEVPVKTYLVQTAGKNVLVDAGKGNELGVAGATPETLQACGIPPEDITDILLTHMDIDHVAGLIHKGKPVFPRATLWVSRVERDAWMGGTSGRSAAHVAVGQRALAAYKGRVQTFDFGTTVLPGIMALDTKGHSPGHTVFDITSGDKGLTIVGDILHIYPVQLRHTGYSAIFDANQSQAVTSREHTLARLSKSDRIVAGMHFPMMGKVRQGPNGGYYVIPE